MVIQIDEWPSWPVCGACVDKWLDDEGRGGSNL